MKGKYMTDQMAFLLNHFRAHELMTKYTRLVDSKDFESLGAIAHPDITLVRIGIEASEGREAFVELYRNFAASDVIDSQHMTTNLQVAELADGSLSVTAPFVAITTHPEGARYTWGRYDDEMAEHNGEWVLTAKRIAITRTAIVGEDLLAPQGASSFAQFEGK